ncbi:MAG: FAD-binding protein [Armatimonadota bacterium]|nr:FAD-binding protein [Armatimonadota bacterium]
MAQDSSVSRRAVIKRAIAAGGAAAGSTWLSSCSSSPTVAWDQQADVLVVGYGGAGAAAAITAAESGASVMILEKAPEAGGNTAVSSGSMRLPSDREKTAQFLKAIGLGAIDDEMARAVAGLWVELEDWFSARGGRLAISPAAARWAGVFPGAEAIDRMATVERPDEYIGVGRDLFAFLDGVVRKQSRITVALSTPVTRLVQNPATRAIEGVVAEREGKTIRIKANRGVIMALGGFEANRAMLATYVEEAPVPIAVSGTPYNTGDGIRMALDVGADLWHMNGVEWARDGFKPPDLPAAFWLQPKASAWISVNRQGRRFRDESVTYGHAKKHLEVFHFDMRESRWLNHPWYLVFDEKTRKAGPIVMVQRAAGRAPFVTYNLARGLHTWSTDNGPEIERGWILRGATIRELAGATGIDPAGLEDSVKRYNGFCLRRTDADFGRDPRQLQPIDTPPFYAMECVVNLINTQGGPRRNSRGQVLGAYGDPIPRLYSCGEFGSIFGFLYPGGCNLPECIISGIIAGRAASSER